ncbi:MAG: hypothetical protein AAFR42_13880 [Cyanobacteria bacterium J06628_6]
MSLTTTQTIALLEALPVFGEVFGAAESDIALRARVGALLAVMEGVAIAPTEIETVIDEVLQLAQQRAQVQTQHWVKAARQWLTQQEDRLIQVVSAYVQTYAQAIDPQELADITSTAVAILGDGRISPSEGRQLTRQLVQRFDLEQALSRTIPLRFLKIARRVASYRSRADLQTDAFSVAQAYLEKFHELLTPELMKQVIQNGSLNVSPQDFLSGDLGDLDEVASLFTFKMQLLEATPPITKAAQAIADQVHESVAAFNRERGAADLLAPKSTGDLSVGINRQPDP